MNDPFIASGEVNDSFMTSRVGRAQASASAAARDRR